MVSFGREGPNDAKSEVVVSNDRCQEDTSIEITALVTQKQGFPHVVYLPTTSSEDLGALDSESEPIDDQTISDAPADYRRYL